MTRLHWEKQLHWQQRGEPTQERVDTRVISLRAATVDTESRSVEAVLSTGSPVEVFDWRAGEPILEVLRADGVELPDQLPLLNTHSRWSLDDVLGSVRNIRREEMNGDQGLIGRLYFADADETAERAWNKVRQGHITDVSVGYRVLDSVDIAPGQKALVKGREYRATNRRLRIATKWKIREASVVPIGADEAAKTRAINQAEGGSNMDPKLREYLESIGLRSDASDADAWQFVAGLTGENQREAGRLATGWDPPEDPPEESGDAGRSDLPADPPTDPAAIATEAIRLERERARELRELAGDDVPEEIRQQAIDEGWDTNRASKEFLQAVRSQRMLQTGDAPAGHSHSHATACNARSLAAGMLAGRGMDPTECRMHNGIREPRKKDQLTEQDADRGDEFRNLSFTDLVRECALIDRGRWIRDPEEAWRAAVSGATLSNVFTTNVYARLMEGWALVGDSTAGWCDEEDVPNFLQQEDISLNTQANLRRLPRGDTATHATASDSHETYKIARYAKQFVIDDQDRIDDRLGAMNRMPTEMGEAARQLRPDMVYSVMLENPTLVADSGAVFNVTAVTTSGGHANLGTAALASDALKDAISAMVKQRIIDPANRSKPGKQVAGNRPRFLIVPSDLEWTARELTAAAALAKLFADSSDPYYAQLNLLAQEGLRVVVDDRIGATGVVDPRSEAARTGSATNWFLAAGGRKSLRVAYRAGTNRAPQLRSFVLTQGQWGVGWDINMDIGVAFMDYIPWYKSTGAA